jgi:hypothetical protein
MLHVDVSAQGFGTSLGGFFSIPWTGVVFVVTRPITSEVTTGTLEPWLLIQKECTVTITVELDALVFSIKLKKGAPSSDNQVGRCLVTTRLCGFLPSVWVCCCALCSFFSNICLPIKSKVFHFEGHTSLTYGVVAVMGVHCCCTEVWLVIIDFLCVAIWFFIEGVGAVVVVTQIVAENCWFLKFVVITSPILAVHCLAVRLDNTFC